MSSLQSDKYMEHMKEGNFFTHPTQKGYRDYYLDLFSQDSNDTEYIAQQVAARKLCTQEFNKNPELQEWNLTNESTTSGSTQKTISTNTVERKTYRKDVHNTRKEQSWKIKQRDYYDELFSSDSDEESTCTNNAENEYIFDLSDLPNNTENNIKKPPTSPQQCNEPTTSSDMDISSTDGSQTNTYLCTNSHQSQSIDSNTDEELEDDMHTFYSKVSFDSLDYLDEEEVIRLQRGTYAKQSLSNTENSPNAESRDENDIQTDKIICHNIQNKYDHMAAAEMILHEQITFAALQEPSATGRHENAAWNAFKKRELASARITSYETQHQVIIYDAWRWGGKEMTDFQSQQNGRLVSIAFEFGNKQQLGIISVYAVTASSHRTNEERKMENKLRNTTTLLMNKIIKEWKNKFPNMCVLIMGDFQETITTSDRDNIGNYRKPQFKNGILKSIQDTHISLVREENPDSYITRFGTEGGRGIDHIMVPATDPVRQWLYGGSIERTSTTSYFPSDHVALQCFFTRIGNNNKTDGTEKLKFDYKKVFKIKVRECQSRKGDVELDTSQFKDSKNFKMQAEMYTKIMKLTNNDSYLTNTLLGKLEKRISNLFQNLFDTGTHQKVSGKNNKLVKITSDQALQLSYITKQFNKGIKTIMNELKLDDTIDEVAKAGFIRMSAFKGKGFKLFANLPIPTKLRYMKSYVTARKRKLEKYIKWARRRKTQRNTQTTLETPGKLFQHLHNLQDSDEINNYGKKIWREYLQETEERENHIHAINHSIEKVRNMKTQHKSDNNDTDNTEDNKNCLILNKIIIDSINKVLHQTGCHQTFNTEFNTEALGFLSKNMNNWKMHILHYDGIMFNPKSEKEEDLLIQDFSKATDDLKKLINQIQRAQTVYKKQNLKYLLASNNIQEFTQKVLPKGREAPIPHNMIFDNKINSFRRCKNENEEMKATSEYHNRWMSPSKAKESCAFAEIIHEGSLGPRGVKLKPNRTIELKDIGKLIHNGDNLPLKIKQDVVRAHGEHTACLFSEPEKDCKFFFYPFFLTNKNGTMNDEDNFRERFLKAIIKIPGKARHEGFQMAVLGRFGERWRQILFNISKLMLVMRYVPPELKVISRFPIPKPGKSGEYRPISLCHDLYCFLNGICTEKTSKGIELANILHDMITSYRKGKGCTNLVSLEQAFREDCIESGLPASQVDEDEEKFFDRISTEMILAAMRVCGFPQQGFLEFKANCMDEKQVSIITNKGTANGTFSCGLEQGNPDSPTIANLVILFKHKIWSKVNKISKDIKDNIKTCVENAYKFFTADKKDLEIILRMMGYCDDNSKFCANKDEKKLISTTYDYIQQTGDLSIVTKIGRKGSKCETHFFNLSADTALNIRECETTAWNFMKDKPTREKVPIKLCLDPAQKQIYKNKVNTDQNLSEAEKEKLLDRINHQAHRHLGITSTLSGDVQDTSSKCVAKINKRIDDLRIQYMANESQTKCVNMLCTTMHSYAPLQANHNLCDLQKCDTEIINKLHSKRGLSKSDAKNRFSIDEKYGGFGFKSFIEEDIVANARELEVLLNGIDTDNKALRARLTAYRDKVSKDYHNNHIRDAVTKLAKFGIYLRDKDDELINYVLGKLSKMKKYSPVGDANYKDGGATGIGLGKEKLLDLSMGGAIEQLIQKIITKEESTEALKTSWNGRRFVSFETVEKAIKSAKYDRFKAISENHNYWEWINKGNSVQVSKTIKDWRYHDMTKNLLSSFGKDACLNMTTDEIHSNCIDLIKIDPQNCIDWTSSQTPSPVDIYGKILLDFIDNDSPLIISTDGSHITGENNAPNHTSASMVLCKLDIQNNNNMDNTTWKDRPVIPLMARTTQLPASIGTSPSDIAHGECAGVILQEESFAGSLPRAVIMDSSAIRQCAINIRDTSHTNNPSRNYVRHMTSGVGKYMAGRLLTAFETNRSDGKDGTRQQHQKILAFTELLKLKLQRFNSIAKTWCVDNNETTTNEDSSNNWPTGYWDNHELRSIHKVNSHQLNHDGTSINPTPRYPLLTPNLAILNSNHHADIAAGIFTMDNPFHHHQQLRDYSLPTSNLRFFFTWRGHTIDKGIAKNLLHTFQLEKLKRMKTKATQGLLWRLQEHSDTKWKKILQHPGWLRSLLGLSNSHTRALYKSSVYRSGAWITHCEQTKLQIAKSGLKEKEKIKILSPCMWCNAQSNRTRTKLQPMEIKGNRLHHFFFCKHKHAVKIRNHMDTLLEKTLQNMMQCYSTLHGNHEAMKLLLEVEETFLNMQSSNIGRLRTLPDEMNPYKSLENWRHDLKASSWEQAFTKGSLQLIDIFNCRPHFPDRSMNDDLLGVAEGMFLGLIPKRLNDLIIAKLLSSNTNATMPHEIIKSCRTQQIKAWDAIQELLIAKSVSLHRILNQTTTSKTNTWNSRYELQESQYRDCKNFIKSNKNSNKKDKENVNKNLKSLQSTETFNLHNNRYCTGITCNKKTKIWNTSKCENASKLNQYQTQCQRCSKHLTAMRKGINILNNIGSPTPTHNISATMNLLASQNIDSPKYKPLMNMLHENVINKQHDEAKFKSERIPNKKRRKTGIPDADKTLCKVIISSVQHASERENIQHTDPLQWCKKSEASLSTAITEAKKVIKLRKKSTDIILEEENQRAANLIQNSLQHKNKHEHESFTNKVEKEKRERTILRTPNELLSGHYMNKGVQELRKYSPAGVYIASPEAMDFLDEAHSTSNWKLFGRTFRSEGIANSRPHGTYLIPNFSGRAANGHWTLIAIQKGESGCTGFHLDSLGIANTTGPAFQKIKTLFNNKRTFSWHQTRSLPQTELECGFRTITAMHKICEGIHQHKSIFQCVEDATLSKMTAIDYNAWQHRKSGTNIIMGDSEWRTGNTTRPLNNSTTNNEENIGSNRKRKQRKRKRGIGKRIKTK